MSEIVKEIKSIYKNRALIKYMISAELKGNYKGTVLGFLWMILDPLFMMLVYVILVSVIFQRGGPQFPILLFSALIGWRWFLQSSTNSLKTYISNRNLIQSINVPLAIFPISKVLLSMITFLASFIPLIPLLLIFDANFSIHLLWLPLIIIVQLIFTLGVSLILSVAGIFFTDLQNIMNFVLKLWFYFSPALYAISLIPEKYINYYMVVNPFASLFNSYKNVLVYGKAPNEYLILFAIEGLIFVFIGLKWVIKSRSFIVKNI
ncbi:MAG: ABC transporter permease [Vicingaceae bacterium]|nr:ABC transporter permease [Vicingaceae bacterium]